MNKGDVIRLERGGVKTNVVILESLTGGAKSEAMRARSDGKDLFMKRFLSPVYPSEVTVTDAKKLRLRRASCAQFEERHREIMRRLSEPIVFGGNLVRPIDFFQLKLNYFKVYPFVAAESSSVIARESVADKELFAKTFLASLRELHARDIVHSDLKPDNLLVERLPAGPVAKVIDFDDAYLAGEPPARALGGDPVYFSPEMVRRVAGEHVDPETLTTSSDIFSAALVLQEVLTGRLPRVGGAPGESHAEILQAGGRIEMQPLDGFPAEFNAALRQAVSLQPADRPSVDVLLESLGVRAATPRRLPPPEPPSPVRVVSGVEIKSNFGTRLNRNRPAGSAPGSLKEHR